MFLLLLIFGKNILVVLWLRTKTRVVYGVHKPFTQVVPVTNNLQTSYKESSPNPVLARNNSIIRTWLTSSIQMEAVFELQFDV